MLHFLLRAQSGLKNLINSIIALGKVVLLSKTSITLPRASSKSLTVLANGPGLTEDLAKIREIDNETSFFCLNFFSENELFEEVKPQFYAILDPVFFHNDPEHYMHERLVNFYKELFEKVSWPMNLCLPIRFKKVFGKICQAHNLNNSQITFVFFNSTNFNGDSKLFMYLYKHKLGMPSPTTVAIPCLMLGIQMGFKKINLAGVNHDFHQNLMVTDDNKVMLRVSHFYDDKNDVSYKPFVKGDGFTHFTMSETFMILYKMFNSYQFVARFANHMGCEIINFTKGSFIDHFKRFSN